MPANHRSHSVSGALIGLTGGIGSGKSTVAARFAILGAAIVDSDAIAHRLTAAGGLALPAIRAAFGDRFIAEDGSLDRAAMRRLVFADPQARQRLQALLHPLIREQAAKDCQSALNFGAPYVLLAIPLLAETGGKSTYGLDRVLLVDCSTETQIARTMARSQLTRPEVEAIIAAQASRQARWAIADDVIDNDGDLAGLTLAVAALHQRYLALSQPQR